MIRSLYYTPGSPLSVDLPVEKFAVALADKEGLLWLDFVSEPNETCEPILRTTFGFHPLAVDDALQETHTPKVDDWGGYLYIVINALDYQDKQDKQDKNDDGALELHELDVFLGSNYVVTHHDRSIPALDQVWAACQRDARHTRNGADHLLYKIADFVVSGYMPIVEDIDREIDEIEDAIFEKPVPETLERIFALKRALLSMRRVITPQREVLNKLARDDYSVIDPKDRVFFRDVYDHLVRLHDLNESMRDMVSGAMDIYLSVINNRMNEVMKALTVITTLFMPISFVAGFFGMNFFGPVAHLDGWTDRSAFIVMLAVVITIPTIMFIWMRRRLRV